MALHRADMYCTTELRRKVFNKKREMKASRGDGEEYRIMIMYDSVVMKLISFNASEESNKQE